MIQPLTVATLAICIVFFPVVMLFGVARFLFIPLADHRRVLHAGVLCAVASPWCRLSRAFCWPATSITARRRGFFGMFDRGFERFRAGYGRRADGALRHRGRSCWSASALFLCVTGALATIDRHRFLPRRRCRHHQAALPRAARHHARRHRKTGAGGRGRASARSSRPTNSIRSTTMSACRSRSTWPSCRPTTSAPWTPRS